jgi:hypothetical protein
MCAEYTSKIKKIYTKRIEDKNKWHRLEWKKHADDEIKRNLTKLKSSTNEKKRSLCRNPGGQSRRGYFVEDHANNKGKTVNEL